MWPSRFVAANVEGSGLVAASAGEATSGSSGGSGRGGGGGG
jgi:hypothetical protein